MSPRSRSGARAQPGPGGVDDGLPTLPDGEPVLHRWFVVSMLVLVLVASAVGVYALANIGGSEPIEPAARRPPGTSGVTHERGAAIVADDATQPGPECATGIVLLGDEVARATGARALEAVCGLLATGDFPEAREGFGRWLEQDGVLRVAAFELTGVDTSARIDETALGVPGGSGGSEDGAGRERLVIELNAKFQREPAMRAAPAVLHELVHFSAGMPGQAVTAAAELAAVRTQAAACDHLDFVESSPRGCRDARELLESDTPLEDLAAAGFPTDP